MNALAVNTCILCLSQAILCLSQAVSSSHVSDSYLHLVPDSSGLAVQTHFLDAHPSAVKQLRESDNEDPRPREKRRR